MIDITVTTAYHAGAPVTSIPQRAKKIRTNKGDCFLAANIITMKKVTILSNPKVKKLIYAATHISLARLYSKIKYATEERQRRFFWQRLTRGWDDSETWSLDQPLAKLIAPRLRRFTELRGGHPSNMTEEEWAAILDKMVAAFEWYASDDRWGKDEFKNIQKHQEGIELFAKHYAGLWW